MALPKCEGQITIPSGGWSVDVSETGPSTGTATVTMAAGNYYWNTTNGANSPLFSSFTSALSANATLNGVYHVSSSLDSASDSSTGKATIALSSGASTFAFVWTNTALRDALGFTSNFSGVTTRTGSSHVQFLWLPNVGRTETMAPVPASSSTDLGAIESDMTSVKSPDGHYRQMVFNYRYVDTFIFRYLIANKVWIGTETITNESLQRFWTDVIGAAKPFRYHDSRDDDTNFWTQRMDDGQNFMPEPVIPGWRGASSLWNVRWKMGKAVGE